MRKFVVLLVAVVLVGVLGWAIDSQSRIPTVRQSAGPNEICICAPGRIEGQTEEIELRTRVLGRVQEVLVEEGQQVAKGDVLVALDDAECRHQKTLAAAELRLAEAKLARRENGARQEERDEAQALVEAKQAELEAAELTWNRIEPLGRKGTVSRQELDDTRSRVAALRAELAAARARAELIKAPAREDEILMDKAAIEAARARVALADVQIERMKLCSPCDARILRVDVEAGELASPDSPAPAVILVDTSRYRVRAFVEEMDAPRVRPGMSATVLADGMPEQVLIGKVTWLSPRMGHKQLFTDDPDECYDTKVREVWIDLDTSEPLVVGLRVDVVIRPSAT